MKSIFAIIVSIFLSTQLFAGTLVMMPYQSQEELESLFRRSDITVHYYSNDRVIATVETFNTDEMTLIDESAFEGTDVYYLVYCQSEDQDDYLWREQEKGRCLYRNSQFLVMKPEKSGFRPYKNDGMVAIFNKKATLPRLSRDFPVVSVENPGIRQMMDQVNKDSIAATVSYLQSLGNRIYDSEGAYAAQAWIEAKFKALGLEVELQPFTYWGNASSPNIIAIQRGTLHPNTYVICGSHYDSFSYYGMCPGADDNATGVASVLESARIMTQHAFEYSIVYCAFSAEEMGLIGSEAYASRCQSQGMDILGYFNNDMNGFLYGDIHIDCIYPNSVEPIGAYYRNIGEVYFPQMPIRHVNFSQGDSDHTSFNNHGYMGIYPFEDLSHYSPYIHTPGDTIGTSVNSWEMSQRYCQMNMACLAEIANLTEGPVTSCNPPVDFTAVNVIPEGKDTLCPILMSWKAPLEGSTGNAVRFKVYRNGAVLGQVPFEAAQTSYSYDDEVPVGDTVHYCVVAVYDDACEASSDTLSVVGVYHPSEIGEYGEHSVVVYPNPAERMVTLKGNVADCYCIDMFGRRLSMRCDDNKIDVSEWSKGVYFLVITTMDGQREVQKLIVNR